MSEHPRRGPHRAARLLALAAGFACAAAAAMPLGYGDPTAPTPAEGLVARDPATGAPQAEAAPNFDLTSTLVAGQRQIAIINGRSVALGGTIDGAHLLAIDARGVQLEYRGRRLRLNLPARDGETVSAKTPRGP